MICIAYFSSAAQLLSSAELGAIVQQAQRNNAQLGVTGLLCHYDGSFLQFLEGDEAAVNETFSRIQRDPRHHQVLPIQRQPIETRAFGDWSMGIVSPDEVTNAQQVFCRRLRDIQIADDADHRASIEVILDRFRAWLR